MDAILVVSHGSRSPVTKQEVEHLVQRLKQKTGASIAEYAFLEIESPSIPEGIDHCVHQGATRLIVLLNFLNSGRHVSVDIPAIIADAQQKYPHVSISMSRPVGQHPQIVELFADLLRHA